MSDQKYFHIILSPDALEQGDNWEGRMLFMTNKWDKNISLLTQT